MELGFSRTGRTDKGVRVQLSMAFGSFQHLQPAAQVLAQDIARLAIWAFDAVSIEKGKAPTDAALNPWKVAPRELPPSVRAAAEALHAAFVAATARASDEESDDDGSTSDSDGSSEWGSDESASASDSEGGGGGAPASRARDGAVGAPRAAPPAPRRGAGGKHKCPWPEGCDYSTDRKSSLDVRAAAAARVRTHRAEGGV
jgi:hypothetical protein